MDSKRITIDDVARDLQLSKTTVSRAISGKGRVGQATRERVMEYIQRTGYKPSTIARGLANSRTYNIAFVMPGDTMATDMPFFQKCLWGISNAAAARDYDVILAMVSENDISQLKRLTDNSKIDGVILGRSYKKDPVEEFLKQSGLPFVVIGTSSDGSVIQIDNDHVGACDEITEFVLKKGCRRPVLIGGDSRAMVNEQRVRGFMKACGRYLIEPEIMLDCERIPEIEKAVEKSLGQGADCIVCMDDGICAEVVSKLEKEGVAFPKDISIVSFYNSPLLDHITPKITALSFDVKELGENSCSILIEDIDGTLNDKKMLLGYRLLRRGSVVGRN